MAHTEGTWECKQLGFAKAGGYVLMRREPHSAARVMRRLDYNGEFTHDDARVLAASPKLLRALIYLRDCLEAGEEPGMSIVHEAIAKATGNGAAGV